HNTLGATAGSPSSALSCSGTTPRRHLAARSCYHQSHRPPPKLGPKTNGPLYRPIRKPQAKDACHKSNSLLARCKSRHRFPASLNHQRDRCDSAESELERGDESRRSRVESREPEFRPLTLDS